MTNKQTFLADNLSFLSTQRGLSLIALAENTGIDPSTVYRLADPANSRQPRARTLRSLADYFHVEPFDLLEKDLRNPSFTKPNQEGLFGEVIPARKSAPLEKSELIPLVKITDADAIDPSVMCLFTETAAGSLRIHSDGGMRQPSLFRSIWLSPMKGVCLSTPCAKVLP